MTHWKTRSLTNQSKLSQAIKQSADVAQSNTEVIKDDTSFVRASVPAIESKIDMIRHDSDRAQHSMLMTWISGMDFPAQQSDIISRKEEGTGQWFLSAPEFVKWLNLPMKTTLFCPGIPGAGKTMIAATTIDSLLENRDSTTGIAYVYCNYQAQAQQNSSNLLAALLKQLVQVQPSITEPVARLHKQHDAQGTRPTITEISDALESVIAKFSTVYLVIDALDECQDNNGSRSQLLKQLRNLQAKNNVHLMVTARYIPEIVVEFRKMKAQTLEVRASADDVKRFVAGQIHRLPKCIQRDTALQGIVQDKIVEAVDGMWVADKISDSDIS